MTRTITVTCSAGTAKLEAPRDGIGFFEACSLTVRGWLDRRSTHGVADTRHTYTLHWLERRHRRIESRIVSRVEPLVSGLTVRAARVAIAAGSRTEADDAVPTSKDLESLDGRDRHAWTKQVRSARRANAERAAERGRVLAAKKDAAELAAELENVAAECDAVRLQWREAFMLRNARYTRARFGRRLEMPEDPSLADYVFADGPDWARLSSAAAPGTRRVTGLVQPSEREEHDEH